MPQNGVYQPTTVSYDRPGGLLAQTASSPMKVLRRPMPQICVLILALVSLAAGESQPGLVVDMYFISAVL